MSEKKLNYEVIALPLRDVVVFPYSIVPLFVGREKSIKALRKAIEESMPIVLVAQKKADVDQPDTKDLYSIGTLAKVIQIIDLPDGTIKALVEGKKRTHLIKNLEDHEVLKFEGEDVKSFLQSSDELEAMRRLLFKELETYLKISKKTFAQPLSSFEKISSLEEVIDRLSSQLPMKLELKQQILEESKIEARLEMLISYLNKEIVILEVEKKLLDRIQGTMIEQQKDYVKRIKNQAIKEEFGDDEFEDLEEKIAQKQMPDSVRTKLEQELKKLRNMNSMSAEAGNIRNYIEYVLRLPFGECAPLSQDLDYAEEVLNEGHSGSEKIKKQIAEILAVQNRTGTSKGQICCFVGPPGVGKTSFASLIAKATQRPFVKISLGGVNDEAAIRGHRRTYVGAVPGAPLKKIYEAGKDNVVMLLDEIDKLGARDNAGPASALLELLDPVQNKIFEDHYLDMPYDFSNVLFICTANLIENIPLALRDRLRFIRIPSYLESEKVQIAEKHLIPLQRQKNGLLEEEFQISRSALLEIIRRYTREAGVRGLDREIESLARKTTYLIERTKLTDKPIKSLHITLNNIQKYLGIPKYSYGKADLEFMNPGVVYGLAYTESGGDLLPIETVIMPKIQGQTGQIIITGSLGDVMKESVRIALTLARAKAKELGIDLSKFENDFHIHVPDGAVPKEGPSAGITLFLSIVSALKEQPIASSFAATGEITLSSKVNPVGGIREKLVAAHRGGIKMAMIPAENEKDLADVPEDVRSQMQIIAVKNVFDALKWVL